MYVPILVSTLKGYDFKQFRADLFAGLTVGVVALPLAMAFAIACGLPPERGIFTAIIAGFLISLFGGSKVQIGGPTGAFVVIIASVFATYGESGLLLSTLMAGGFLILFGIFRMGALIRFIPFPVTTGFTSGIAVVIFSTQVKDLLGLEIAEVPAAFFAKWGAYFSALNTISPAAVGISLGTIAAIVLLVRYFPKIPAMLIAMIGATVVVKVFGLDVQTIGMKFGNLPSSLPLPSLPDLTWQDVTRLVPSAFTIALLAAIESLLSATVADGMTGERHKPNAELIGQGIGNIGSALFGGFAATGAIARTATNIKCGAKTPIAGMIHAVTLTIILLLFSQYASMVPLAALAGILAVVCYNMSEIHTFRRLLRGPKSDACVLLITFALTVIVDLVVAVEVGVVLAALLFIRRMAEVSNVSVVTGDLKTDIGTADDINSIQTREVPEGVEVFEVQGPFFFGAVDQFKDTVLKFQHKDIKVVIIRMRQVPAIDATGLYVLRDFYRECKKRDTQLVISGVHSQPLRAFARCGFLKELGRINACPHIDAALERARAILNGAD